MDYYFCLKACTLHTFQSRDRSRCLATFIEFEYIMIEPTHFHVFYHVEER